MDYVTISKKTYMKQINGQVWSISKAVFVMKSSGGLI